MKVEMVADDNAGNWIAPGHGYDLKGIVGHYRRMLPRYSEFYVQNQKKRILRELESVLATF